MKFAGEQQDDDVLQQIMDEAGEPVQPAPGLPWGNTGKGSSPADATEPAAVTKKPSTNGNGTAR
jgi:hypothetical protein